MSKDLSLKQSKILEFIKSQVQQKGYPPSVREICKAVNLKSTSTVHAHLGKLEKKGYIRRDPTKTRAIEILNWNNSLFNNKNINVPVVESIPTKKNILAVENIKDTFPVSKKIVGDNVVFMFKVKEEHIIYDGIKNEDYVLVKKQDNALNGDIILALINERITIKKFCKETENVTVLGKIIGLFRTM